MRTRYSWIILLIPFLLAACAEVDEEVPLFDPDPPGDVTSFTATPGVTVIQLDWVNPTDIDFAGVLIMRSTASAPATTADGVQAFNGNSTSFLDSGLTTGTTYFYTAFAFDDLANFSAGASVSGVPN